MGNNPQELSSLRRRVSLTLLALLSLTWGIPGFGNAQTDSAPLMARAQSAYQQGHFEEAADSWTRASEGFLKSGNYVDHLQALIFSARALTELGKIQRAQLQLQTAIQTAEIHQQPYFMAQALGQLGTLHLTTGDGKSALQLLQEGLTIARNLEQRPLAATILNDLGNAHAFLDHSTAAIAAYTEASILADSLDLQSLSVRAMVNAAVVETRTEALSNARLRLRQALKKTVTLPESHEKVQNFLVTGRGLRALSQRDAQHRPDLFTQASNAFQAAIHTAKAIGNWRQESYGWGYLAEMYEEEGRHREALKLTQRAIRANQQGNAPETLYQWEWKAGRYFKHLGQTEDAIQAYQRAIATLQPIRQEIVQTLPSHPRAFKENIGALFYELADVLLDHANQQPKGDERNALLYKTRDTIETFKAAELQDYFKDDCVDVNQARIQPIDQVAPHTAIIYPIVFPSRTEILISIGETISRITIPMSGQDVTQRIHRFRSLLEKRTTHQYLPHAQALYTLLIRPLEPTLKAAQVDTLVFVPDGAWRTIPIAALHDGQKFLVQQYAIATTPGVTLTDARRLNRQQVNLLSVGLTEGVQGFTPLPNVEEEIQNLQNLFGGTTLLNQDFRATNLQQEMKQQDFTVVHIASHGKFDQDPQNSFVLAYDQKLTMNALAELMGLFQFRQTPLDLLTLSACETAAGDERAALGLAGVAIKSGARSALATLWFINDQASSLLVNEFYRELIQPANSKAHALRRAQLKLLEHATYRHPSYWAPFLLINNWL